MQTPITITNAAINKVSSLVKEEGDPSLMLRIYIVGGGCSGFQYGYSFVETSTEGDLILEESNIRFVIDPMSLQLLQGAELDYVEGLQGAQFVINNPNAKTTCGCGSSFSID